MSSLLPRRRMRRSGLTGAAGAAEAAEAARLHPWQPAHFCAATAPRADTRPKSSPRSTSTITGSWSASGSADDQVKYSLRFPLNRTSTIGVNSLLVQRAHRKVLLLAPSEELFDLQRPELAGVAAHDLADGRRCRVGVGVRAAGRLGNDLVHDPQRHKVLGRDLEGVGGPLPLARVLPEDGRAALRRDDGVH